MTDRALKILDAVVREFIDSGEPVSSAFLYEAYDFGIRPAMIRAELAELAGEGYLAQPHHSAGRVPSDLGLEFFASRALDAVSHLPASRVHRDLYDNVDAWEEFLTVFSRQLGVLGIAGDAGEDGDRPLRRKGLDYLIENLLVSAPEVVPEVVRDIESISEKFHALGELFPEEDMLEVFIGRKSPLTKSDGLALVVGDCGTREGRVFVVAVGPKRMDYEKTAKVFNRLKQYGETLRI